MLNPAGPSTADADLHGLAFGSSILAGKLGVALMQKNGPTEHCEQREARFVSFKEAN